ncbi:MAG: 4-hydroxy-tetrahydrodipicolinate reductase, partial [Planctomycetota bacterium]|nr:4-hydroxy-tetrahydrodipicolinate reductase [Planctomycetota bacterium]
DVATANIAAALDAGCHVVVGTSGLTGQQYDQIDAHARRVGRGVLACGNFALSAVLMMKFSELATRWFPRCEVIDYAGGGKIDAPSGTARELAHRVGRAGASAPEVALDEVQGERDARGAHLDGVQVHSVRLPSFVLAVESIFGATDERLTIRHDAGSSAEPYVGGALLAIQRVGGLIGLARGLDQVLDM